MTSEAKIKMGAKSARCVTEATRQLTALEGAVQAIVSELRVGQIDRTTASIKREMLESLWKDGNATLLRIEAQTGPHPRRAKFSEAYLAARRSLERMREAEGAAPPLALDTTTLATSSRHDHLPRIELPRFSGAPSEWPSFAAKKAHGHGHQLYKERRKLRRET
uniref:Uncharacterized protein n=1 Tax=Anopheles atroparvus TaxID=41427 RepID=A0A182IJ16_ANOAO